MRKQLHWLLFSLIISSCSLVYGQKTRELQGRVVSDEAEITFVTIQNLRTERATITDLDGYFAISATVGDSLIFSAVQLKKKTVVVTPSLFDSDFFQVPMEIFITRLDGVIVTPYDLSGNLGTDAKNLNVAPVTAESLGLPNARVRILTQSERKLYEASSGPLLYFPGVNVNKLLNALSGRTKRLKSRVKLEKEDRELEEAKSTISDSLYLKELRITADRLNEFMYYCSVDPEYPDIMDSQDQFRLWEFFVRKSEAFRKNNGLE